MAVVVALSTVIEIGECKCSVVAKNSLSGHCHKQYEIMLGHFQE